MINKKINKNKDNIFYRQNQTFRSNSYKNTHKPKPLTDSTPILTARDLQELINLLQDYPARYTNPITQWLQQRYYARKTELGY